MKREKMIIQGIQAEYSLLYNNEAGVFADNISRYAYTVDVRDSDAFLEQILPAARYHIIIECCGMYEYLDHVVPKYYHFFEAVERRFQKKTVMTEFVFSSPAQAYEAVRILVPPVAERVKMEQNFVRGNSGFSGRYV